jgi:hypothetical protein
MGAGVHGNTSWNATIASSSTVTTADDVFPGQRSSWIEMNTSIGSLRIPKARLT